MIETEDFGLSIPPEERKTGNGCRDRMLLLGVALLVCLVGVAAFLLSEIYKSNPIWIFLGLNSIGLFPILRNEFRGYFNRPGFVAFFAIWMCLHGLTVVGLMIWVPLFLWPLALILELAIGFVAAHYLFRFPLQKSRP
ncbi:MAG TPA: hypothetical protein VFP96_14930 [Candidatus Acidoferrum sp.]|nr:hypothetical protein [Candidatus Acidoferrum sp.]